MCSLLEACNLLVTGASKGISRGVALRFAEVGFDGSAVGSAAPVAEIAFCLRERGVGGDHHRRRRVADGEFPRKPAGPAGVEIHAEKIDLCVQHTSAVGDPQDLETPRAAQASIDRHDPGGDKEFLAKTCGIPVVDPGVTHGHSPAQGETLPDRQAQGRRVLPGGPIQPLQVNRIVDVGVGIDLRGVHPVRRGEGCGQSELQGAQYVTPVDFGLSKDNSCIERVDCREWLLLRSTPGITIAGGGVRKSMLPPPTIKVRNAKHPVR